MQWYSKRGLYSNGDILNFLNKLDGLSIPPEHIKFHNSPDGLFIFYYHSEKVLS